MTMRSRRTALAVAAATTVLGVLAGCGEASPTAPAGADAPATTGQWQAAGTGPLSARTDPFLGWTGEEVLVIGGNTGWVCPPTADCVKPEPGQFASDGAAWNPTTGEWRPIADLPVPIYTGWSFGLTDSAVLDGQVVVHDRSQEAWLRYDVAADAWSELDPPGPGFTDLSQDDGTRIWGLRGDEVVSWEPVSGRVRVERSYDVSPRLDDPRLVLTEVGPVVTGVRYDDVAPDEPTLELADLPDGDGWRRVTSGQIGWFYASVAGQVVGPEAGGADGGEVNGWDRWYPSAGMLDPTTGEWAPLDVPQWPLPSADDWHVTAYGDDVLVTGGHYRDLAHDGEWLRLGRPDSTLDASLSSVWAADRLFVWGGIDDEDGYDAPAVPDASEAWTWTPPADAG